MSSHATLLLASNVSIMSITAILKSKLSKSGS